MKQLGDYRCFVINLDNRFDRLTAFAKEISMVGIKAKRVSAIKDDNGQRGLLLSYKRILQESKEKGYQQIIIFEDDTKFIWERNVTYIIAQALKQLPENWELLYLGAKLLRPTIPFSQHLSIITKNHGTQSVAINHTIFDDIIKNIDITLKSSRLKETEHIDNMLSIKFHKNNKSFIIKPMLTYQASGYSDILKVDRDTKDIYLNNEKKYLL